MRTDGIDMRVVDGQGRAVKHFPDLDGPRMDELMVSRLGAARADQVRRLQETGMGSVPDDVPQMPPRWNSAGELDADLLPGLRDDCGVQGIALHKLSIDAAGWWVTGRECAQALHAWERSGRPVIDDEGDLIPFLKLCVSSGNDGFRVWPAY
jgi:hypothetical protein